MWIINRADTGRVNSLNQALIKLRDSLLKENIDFDYGDEEMLSRHGKVVKSKAGVNLLVGKAAYSTVVIPPMLTIRSTTLDLLKKFALAGGKAVQAGRAPWYVDAKRSGRAGAFASLCMMAPEAGKKLASAVETARRVSILDHKGDEIAPALHLLCEDKDAFYLLVVNTGHSRKQLQSDSQWKDCMVRDRRTAFPVVRIAGFKDCAGFPCELDPETGGIFRADARRKNGKWEISTSLPACGSRLFVIPRKAAREDAEFQRRRNLAETKRFKLDPSEWDVSLSEHNVLVLDKPAFRIGTGRWNKPTEILRVDKEVRRRTSIPPRGGEMMQPWARPRNRNPKTATVDLCYEFDVERMPGGDLCLCLERPQTFSIRINGIEVGADSECGWWCDRSLRKIPVDGSILKKGRNEILLTCCYSEDHSGLEIAYLLGDFGVKLRKGKPALTARPWRLQTGDWVGQGLPFYSGSVTYRKEIRPELKQGQRLFLELPDYRATAVRVIVDGKPAGIAAWEPDEIDITDFVRPAGGKPVELGIELFSHRRNSHGPFHYSSKWPVWTGPNAFTSKGKLWTDDYQLVPCGLMQCPVLSVRRICRS